MAVTTRVLIYHMGHNDRQTYHIEHKLHTQHHNIYRAVFVLANKESKWVAGGQI